MSARVAGGRTGLLLDGRYLLGGLLGRGGMAEVHAADDVRLARPVAVKLLGASPAADRGRFAAEVRTLARLEHPNIVRLLDAGGDGEGRAYLVMELVEGESLATRLGRGPLSPAEVARIGGAVASGLAYVHARGVVHRDVKPGNILLGPEGRVRLADFGIARLVDTGGITATGVVLGTPAYLAPEQVTGGAVGPPADVYALGLVLVECLTGRRVFDGPPAESAAARLYAAPLDLPELPSAWAAAVATMTAVEPASRPAAAAAAEAIAGAGAAGSSVELVATARPAEGSGVAASSVPTVVATAHRQRSGDRATTAVAGPPARTGGDQAPRRRRARSTRPAVVIAAATAMAVLALLGLGVERALSRPPATTSGGSARDGTSRSGRPGTATGTSTVPAASRRAETLATQTTAATTTSPPATTTTSPPATTTTSPPATTTSAPGAGPGSPGSLYGALRSFAAALTGGEDAGTVSPGAAATLVAALQELARGGPGSVSPDLDRLASDLTSAVGAGEVSGSSIGGLDAAVGELAAALGVPAPKAAPPHAAAGSPGPGGPAVTAPTNGQGGSGRGYGHHPDGAAFGLRRH